MIWTWVICLAVALTSTYAQFKTCEESETCNFLRNKAPNPNEFQVLTAWGVEGDNSSISLNVLKRGNTVLQFTASFLLDKTIRFQIQEIFDSNRYFLDTALFGTPRPDQNPINWLSQNTQNVTMVWGGDHTLIVHSDPFVVEIYHVNDLVAIFNADGRLTFDHEGNNRAVGFDISFPLATFAYGLPLHADNLLLRQTGIGGADPYRLYNVEGGNYEINSTRALSGAVPVLFAHGPAHTAGVFFHNAYETWVDIDYSRGNLAIHYMVEDGIFDAFVMLGPLPSDVYRQYTTLTGVTPLPPKWSLGYHHGALPGENASSLLNLVQTFDALQVPLDSVFIAGQDATFSWDENLFPNPLQFLLAVGRMFRKVVLSVNPFIHYDLNDSLFETAVLNNYLILAPSRQPYTGVTYVGNSVWWDFTNINADRYFVRLFEYDNFPPTTGTVAGFWNILNQPFVMGEEENVLPEENMHFTGLYHKDVHNIYSHMMNQATFFGLFDRGNAQRRPFVLADAFFAGSQRYAAIYTGNSEGDWDHLAISYRMCLSASLAGIPFCGTDVGGLNNLASEELLIRWYQTAIWLPLFRSSSIERGRKPDELSEEALSYIRIQINLRYSLIDYFYTLFYEHERFKNPVIKPLFYQYPELPETFQVENGFVVGDEVLVYPITQSNQTQHIVYLPPGVIWYDTVTPTLYVGYGFTLLNTYIGRIPHFYRAGGIVYRRDRLPKTTAQFAGLSFTVQIFVDRNRTAIGRIYLDDGDSYNYRRNEYSYILIEFADEEITFSPIDPDAHYTGEDLIISQYGIYRPPSNLKSTDDGTGIPITPEFYDTAADGTPLKDIKINLKKTHRIRLR